MSLSFLFDKIVGRQRQREQARANDFRSLVRAIADGKEPDPDHVDRVLIVTGQTLDDLRAAVGQYQHRLELRARLETLPKLEAEQRDVRKQIEKAEAALAQAEAKHAEAVWPLTS